MAWLQFPLLVALTGAAPVSQPVEAPQPVVPHPVVAESYDCFAPSDLWQLHLSSTPRLRSYREGARIKIPIGLVTFLGGAGGALWWGIERQLLRRDKKFMYPSGIAIPAAGGLSGLVLAAWGVADAARLDRAKHDFLGRLAVGFGAGAESTHLSVSLRF